MLTAEQVAAHLGIESATVAPALADINQAALLAEESALVTFEVWDKSSPINGTPAEAFLAREDVRSGGEVYIIRDERNGRTFFQPHTPGVDGLILMSPNDVAGYAEAHCAAVIDENMLVRVCDEVYAILQLEGG